MTALPDGQEYGRRKLRIGPFVLSSHGRYVADALSSDPSVPVPPPAGFRSESGGAERRISWRWVSWESVKGLFFPVVFGVPFAFVLYAYLHAPAGKPWPPQAVAMLALFGLAPAVFTYGWLAYLVNRTTLILDAGHVRVRHGPLPWRGAKVILRSQISRVFSERVVYASSDSSDGTAFEPRVTYRVRLVLRSGETVTLASGLLAPEQALFIEQQVRAA